MKTAIITGASAGLGIELLRALIEKDDVDRYIIIARRKERLEKVASNYPDKDIVCLSIDITNKDDLDSYKKLLSEKDTDVKYLINNAGFGRLGEFYGSDANDQSSMVTLNCKALTEITALTLPHMKKGGEIINICSIASFVPNAFMTVYSSTKAYVMSFSRGLRFELKKRKINVLAVCPGPMKTEFLPVAGIEKGSSHTFDTLPYCEPYKVARGAIKASSRKKAVYTPRLFYKFYRVLSKILPHSILMHFSKV